MSTTRARVVRRILTQAHDEPLLTVEHRDYMRSGPTVGPLTVTPGAVLFWLGASGAGEPIPLGPGQSIIITCEIDE